MQINLSSTTIMSYRDFVRTLKGLVTVEFGSKIRFTSAYPKKTDADKINPPIITYSVLTKRPGAFGQTNEIKPRHRETQMVTNEKGREIPVTFMGQVFDYEVLFELWADDGDAADELVETFQHFMSKYTGALKKAGAIEIIFNGMDGDVGSAEWKIDLIKRNMIYRVRLDEVLGIRSPVIDEITINTLVHDSSYNMLFNLAALEKDESRESLYEEQGPPISDDDSQPS